MISLIALWQRSADKGRRQLGGIGAREIEETLGPQIGAKLDQATWDQRGEKEKENFGARVKTICAALTRGLELDDPIEITHVMADAFFASSESIRMLTAIAVLDGNAP